MSELEYDALIEVLDSIDLACKDISKMAEQANEDAIDGLQSIVGRLDDIHISINKLTMDHEDVYGEEEDSY